MAGAKGSSSAVRLMAAGWGLFTGSHLVTSHPPCARPWCTPWGREALPGLTPPSLATFLPTTFVYIRYPLGPAPGRKGAA